MANDQLAIEAHHRKVANPFSFSFKTEQTSTQNQRKPKKTLLSPSFMGFPVGYSDLLFPKLIFQLIFFLNFLRRLISSFFAVAGLSHLIESDAPWPDSNIPPELCSASAILIQEILPVVRFDELLKGQDEGQLRPFTDGCAVCLFEFEEREEVRWLSNCRHVFHRGCLDRWVDHDQRTCPLCRTLLIPEEMQEAFDRRIWASAGVDGSFAGGEFDDSSTSVSPP